MRIKNFLGGLCVERYDKEDVYIAGTMVIVYKRILRISRQVSELQLGRTTQD